MSFTNYRFTESEEKRQYTRGHSVALVGTSGVLADYIKSLEPIEHGTIKWELFGADIARLVCPDCDNPHKELILDHFPKDTKALCLSRVEKIVGVSSDDWTDAVLVTRPLPTEAPAALDTSSKETFSVPLPIGTRENMEAIGIKGGYQKGTFTWTQPKMNIGAAVCDANGRGSCSCGSSESASECCGTASTCGCH